MKRPLLLVAVVAAAWAGSAGAVPSDCEDCHAKLTPLLVKAGDLARLDAQSFETERARITDACEKCHTPSFVAANIANGDQMLKEADKLFAEAINLVMGLRRDGVIEVRDGEGVYPQLLSFYEVDTHVEQVLYEMFMDHRMKTIQGAFHLNPDHTTWYGYAKLKKDLAEIRELDEQMRAQHTTAGAS